MARQSDLGTQDSVAQKIDKLSIFPRLKPIVSQ